MCDICVEAYEALKPMVEQLEERFPGTEVDGEKVSKGHHVTTAIMRLRDERLREEILARKDEIIAKLRERGIEVIDDSEGDLPPMFGGPQKVIEA